VDRLILDARLGCKIKANFCVVSAVTSHQLKETCHRQPRFLGRRSTCVWWLLWTGIEIRPKCISIVGDSFAKKNSRRFFREEATWQSIFPLTPWYYQRTATISPNVTTNQLRLTHNCLSIHNPNSLELQYITVLVGHYKERIILIVRGTTQEYTSCKCQYIIELLFFPWVFCPNDSLLIFLLQQPGGPLLLLSPGRLLLREEDDDDGGFNQLELGYL
jgi:hypothetical protein